MLKELQIISWDERTTSHPQLKMIHLNGCSKLRQFTLPIPLLNNNTEEKSSSLPLLSLSSPKNTLKDSKDPFSYKTLLDEEKYILENSYQFHYYQKLLLEKKMEMFNEFPILLIPLFNWLCLIYETCPQFNWEEFFNYNIGNTPLLTHQELFRKYLQEFHNNSQMKGEIDY